LSLNLPPSMQEQQLQELKQILQPGKIPLALIFEDNNKRLQLTTQNSVALDEQLLKKIEQDYQITISCQL
jgi:hypothetical protein